MALQSSQRLPELLFYTKKSYRILQLQFQLQFYKGTHTPSIHIQPTRAHYTTLQSREFSIQNPILHAEDKELFEYCYYIQRAKRPSLQIPEKKFYTLKARRSSRNPSVCSTGHSRYSSRKTFQRHSRHSIHSSLSSHSRPSRDIQTFQSFMTFQPFQAILQILQCSSISRESNPLQHSPTRMHILQFLQLDWFPQKTPPSTSWEITNISTNITFFKEREMLRYWSKLTYSPE